MLNKSVILMVENFPDDVFLIRRALVKAGINNPVRVAWGGEEAICYLNGQGRFANREHFPLPGLVFLELKLPKMDGLELLRWIGRQPRFRSLRVVVLTGSAHPRSAAAAYSLGAVAFLTKPTDFEETTRLMAVHAAQWLAPQTSALRQVDESTARHSYTN
jgi:CheY-like chemotaxis protein